MTSAPRPSVALGVALLGLVLWKGSAAAQLAPQYRHAAEATVLIEAEWEIRGRLQGREVVEYVDSNGSGFLIAPQGIIVTNNHVVNAAFVEEQVRRRYAELAEWVEFRVRRISLAVTAFAGTGEQIVKPGNVVRYDRKNDLALMSVNFGRDMPYLILHAPVDAPVGAPVTVCGFPANAVVRRLVVEQGHGAGGTEVSVSQGRVTALRRDREGVVRLIQLDAAVTGGNSGGPVVGGGGAVLGVLASTVGGSVNFGIAADSLAEFAEKYIPEADRPRIIAGRPAGPADEDGDLSALDRRLPEVTLHLRNGRSQRGLLKRHGRDRIVLKLPGLGMITYRPDEVARIEPAH